MKKLVFSIAMMSLAFMSCSKDSEIKDSRTSTNKANASHQESSLSKFDELAIAVDISSIENFDDNSFYVNFNSGASFDVEIIEYNDENIQVSINQSDYGSWRINSYSTSTDSTFEVVDVQNETVIYSGFTGEGYPGDEEFFIAGSFGVFHYDQNGDTDYDTPDDDLSVMGRTFCSNIFRSNCEKCSNFWYRNECSDTGCSSVTADCICLAGDFNCYCMGDVSCN